jgi:spore coat polysaccharide biosynthesis protein SpsF
MYITEQEKFWANEFGTEYIERNQGEQLLASNLNFFSKALQQAGIIESCIEFGANIGMNLKALQLLYPSIRMKAIEINGNAANILGDFIGKDNVYNGSIFEHTVESKVQLSLIKGVLIHINPNMLQKVYEQLYNCSEKFILIAEYYNPTPVALNYRGHEDRLFKRDFAGEFLDKYKDTELIDYGFSYRRDPAFPQDDITWFLIKKK